MVTWWLPQPTTPASHKHLPLLRQQNRPTAMHISTEGAHSSHTALPTSCGHIVCKGFGRRSSQVPLAATAPFLPTNSDSEADIWGTGCQGKVFLQAWKTCSPVPSSVRGREKDWPLVLELVYPKALEFPQLRFPPSPFMHCPRHGPVDRLVPGGWWLETLHDSAASVLTSDVRH